ncbi:acyl-CoA synthetase [Lentzea sp. NBRC 105346]|uniref:fatty acyl-AMP ligase n=1 Tax=Lentzea sp. NBRC 105346 TaxID=3032205 RepID=UPI0024A2A31A|nr:fatty acyl-AMP ligase [Lentzea sp. NBRC 105346]GLZ28685.1 acyl-CoA synthetase [Lentzea sp. NBRC 105346]
MLGVDVASLVDLCRRQAEIMPDERAFVFLDSGVVEQEVLTYSELDRRARSIAVWLRSMVRPGARALLCHPPGLDFVSAFLGCLYADVVAVPAPPVRRASGDARHVRLLSIAEDCDPDLLLSTEDTGFSMGIPELATDVLTDRSTEWREDSPTGVAYLQYTSGTTGRPRGVVLTHHNVLRNLSLIVRNGSRPDERFERGTTVCWLPPFHDMGLIGGILQPLFLGHESVLMSAQAFYRTPANWLRAIDRYRAEVAAAPSLGYDLCLRRVTDEQLGTFDLSRWRIAAISDEPLRARTIEEFAQRFAPCGFRKAAFFPSYGMAESTVLVSGGPVEEEPIVVDFDADALEHGRVREALACERVQRLVGCGDPDPSLTIVIVRPGTDVPCDVDEVGEILVSGPSIGEGYWGDPEATRDTFGATVLGRGDQRFLRTGNLGFRYQGQLFITCRVPDLLVIDDRQLYPYDVEATAEAAHPAVRAACAVDRRVFAELDRRYRSTPHDEIREAVRAAVQAEHGYEVSAVVVLMPGALPYTTSGKLCRAAVRELGGS